MFLLMFPFFLFMSFFFFMLSFFFLNLNFSFFFNWTFFFSSFYVSFPIYMDYISCSFMGLVLLISGSIIFYCDFYMYSDIYKSRFFFLMLFFVISMIFLILSPNFICMLLGWDGLGLISFCLVMYYQNFKSFVSSLITALVNRIGDVFILASISMFFFNGSWSYMNFLSFSDLYWLSLFFLIASMTKSAQIPFSAWLPAAMAAPTPVSSLVHSSTLVTAGVYILIRFSYLMNENMKFFLMLMSLMTMIMSGLSGLMEFDLKKIIALSTLSQLGFMMFSISLSMFDLSFFHLICHASFKALLFMCAGYFIHMFSDNQDIRSFGMLNQSHYYFLSMFNVANLSLCGFPFLTGFFSKDLILEFFFMKSFNLFFFVLAIFGTFLTVFYSFRLFIFLTFKNSFCFNYVFFNFKNFSMVHFSMIFLFFLSICLGFLGSNLFLLPYNYVILPNYLKMLVLMICIFSFIFCFYFSKNYFELIGEYYHFLHNMWFLEFLKLFLKKSVFNFSKSSSFLTLGYLELFFGNFLVNFFHFCSLKLNLFFKSFLSFFFSGILFIYFLFLFFSL